MTAQLTFADQTTLTLEANDTVTFFMHTNLKFAYERGMEQSMTTLATTQLANVTQSQLLALLTQAACFQVNQTATYHFTAAIVACTINA